MTEDGAARLRVNRVRIDILVALDIADLMSGGSKDAFLAHRVETHWLTRLADFLHEEAQPEVHSASLARSAYASTPRGYRPTLSQSASDMPLVIKVEERPRTYDFAGQFQGRVDSLTINAHGILCIRYVARQVASDWLTVNELTKTYGDLLPLARVAGRRALGWLSQTWNTAHPFQLDPSRYDASSTASYEVVDFTAGLASGGDVTNVEDFKALFANQSTMAAAADLFALARMSEASAASGRNSRLPSPGQLDFGYRPDEFWAITNERALRSHPSASDPIVEAFFEDVRLAAAILLMATLSERSATKRGHLGEIALYEHHLKKTAHAFQRDLNIVLGVAADCAGRPNLVRDSRHEFFREAVDRMTEAMGLDLLRRESDDSLGRLLSLSSTIAAQESTQAGERLQRTQAELSAAANRLSFSTAILSVLMVLIGLVQILVVIQLAGK